MSYDQVIQRQRDLIYAVRDRLLEAGQMQTGKVMEIAEGNIAHFLRADMDWPTLNRYILDNISYRLEEGPADISDMESVRRFLLEKVEEGLKEQERRLGSRERMAEFMRAAVLDAIDSAWVEQVDYLQQLQMAVSGRATAQRNLVFEYQDDAYESFRKMERAVKKDVVRNILLSDVYVDRERRLHILFP